MLDPEIKELDSVFPDLYSSIHVSVSITHLIWKTHVMDFDFIFCLEQMIEHL